MRCNISFINLDTKDFVRFNDGSIVHYHGQSKDAARWWINQNLDLVDWNGTDHLHYFDWKNL